MQQIKRKSCRAIILTPDDEILLIRMENPEGAWEGWITPGGGIHDNEDQREALKRELLEELGVNLELGPIVWTRTHTFPWKGQLIEQDEIFYLIRSEHFTPIPDPQIPDLLDLKEFRWWPIEDLLTSHDNFAPGDLYQLLKRLLTNGIPPEPIAVGA